MRKRKGVKEVVPGVENVSLAQLCCCITLSLTKISVLRQAINSLTTIRMIQMLRRVGAGCSQVVPGSSWASVC
jgi:hypothetical protein